MTIIYAIPVCILLIIIGYSLFWYRPRKLWPSKKAYFRWVLLNAVSKDPNSAIVSCDTVLEHIMKELWNRWTVAEMLKDRKKMKNVEYFWKYHKLRNKVVHEMHPPRVTPAEVEEFRKKIEDEFLN